MIQVSPSSEPEPTFHTPAKRPKSGTQARKRLRTPHSSFPNILTRHLPQDQQSEIFPHPTQSIAPVTASSLEKTYSSENAAGILRGKPLEIQQQGKIYTKIYLAIERSDQFQRICYYAFAKLHKKGTSVDPIVKEIKDVLHLPAEDTKQRVYHLLSVGNKWAEIISQFASIVEDIPQQVIGLLSLLGSASK